MDEKEKRDLGDLHDEIKEVSTSLAIEGIKVPPSLVRKIIEKFWPHRLGTPKNGN